MQTRCTAGPISRLAASATANLSLGWSLTTRKQPATANDRDLEFLICSDVFISVFQFSARDGERFYIMTYKKRRKVEAFLVNNKRQRMHVKRHLYGTSGAAHGNQARGDSKRKTFIIAVEFNSRLRKADANHIKKRSKWAART